MKHSMEKIYVVTSVHKKYKYLLGPSFVAVELFKEFQKIGYECIFYDTYRRSKFMSILAYIKIFIHVIFTKKVTLFIHSQGYITSLIFCIIQWIRPSHNVIYTAHGLPLKENLYRCKKIKLAVYFQELSLKVLLLLARKIVCVSTLQSDYIKINYKTRENIYVIHNGVAATYCDFNRLDIRTDNVGLRAIMAGGIANRKSIIETLRFVSLYNSTSNNKWKLDVYGNISDQDLMPLVTDYCERSNGLISYHGEIDQTQLHIEIQNSDLYVAISKWDTFNLAAIQAMSFGVPCICSIKSGVSELITHEVDGFLVDIDSPDFSQRCVQILRSISNMGDGYRFMRLAAYQIAATNNWSCVASKYIKLSLL